MKTVFMFIGIMWFCLMPTLSYCYNSSDMAPTHQNITNFTIDNLLYRSSATKSEVTAYKTVINRANQSEDTYINLIHHFYDPNAIYFCSTNNSGVCLLPNAKAFAISYFDQAKKSYWQGKRSSKCNG